MLYLAEVQKQNKGFMGGVETKLKLLACQRNDQSWSIISGNESISSEEASDFGDGALVTVKLGVNRQVQSKPESASKRVISILQGFSRLLEKTKNQEQEIEQWKESLTIQSEELSRREIEMEARLEQVEQMEVEFKQFEQQRQEIAEARAEVDQVKAEFEAKSQELEGAWAQLKGQQQLLEEQIKESRVLDEAQANQILEHLQSLSSATTANDSVTDKLRLAFEAVNGQQEILDFHWQELEQLAQNIQNKCQELDECQQHLDRHQAELKSLIVSLAEAEAQLRNKQQFLQVKQELVNFLTSQEQAHNGMQLMFSGLDNDSSDNNIDNKIDVKALENIPLPDLEEIVANLQKDLEKLARFVGDQEEELGWQCKAVEELEAKIAQANEFDRFTLEQELADEKEAKKMLDQTLVGQRRTLKEKYSFLLQHSRILKRRQGVIDLEAESQALDLEPIKKSLQQQQAELVSQKQQITQEIEQVEQTIQQLQADLQQKIGKKDELEATITQKTDNWQQLKINVAELQSKNDFYKQHLQPLQDSLNNIRQKLSDIENSALENSDGNSSTAIAEIERMINELTAT